MHCIEASLTSLLSTLSIDANAFRIKSIFNGWAGLEEESDAVHSTARAQTFSSLNKSTYEQIL